MSEIEAVDPDRKKTGQFVKGQSGNPAGRPKGTRNQVTILKMQMEGELRSRQKKDLHKIVEEIYRQALPTVSKRYAKDLDGNVVLDENGDRVVEEYLVSGDKEMLKLIYNSWVSKAQASDEAPAREKIQIVIGKLDQVPAVEGRVVKQDKV